MVSLKDGDEGYYTQKPSYKLTYIYRRNDSWYAQFTDDGLVSLTSVTSKHYHRCSNQEQAAKDFKEEAIAKKNNLERVLKNFSKK